MNTVTIRISFLVFFIAATTCSDFKLQSLVYNSFPKEIREYKETSKLMDKIEINFSKFIVSKVPLEKFKDKSAKDKMSGNLIDICSEENSEGMGKMNIIEDTPTKVSLEIVASYIENNMCVFADIAVNATGVMLIRYFRPPSGINAERYKEKLQVFSKYLKFYQLNAIIKMLK